MKQQSERKMSKIEAEMFEANIGQIIVDLVNRNYTVRIYKESGSLSGDIYILSVTNNENGKPYTIREAMTVTAVMAIQDTRVIADAIVEKHRKAKTI